MPIKKIVDLARSKNSVLIDGTQGAPHLHLDMQDIDCDFYAISCHKMYGLMVWEFFMLKKWIEVLPPYQGGGGMISEVKKDKVTFANSPTRFEAGTMQTAEVVVFSESLKFIESLGMNNIQSHENEILEYGIEKLKNNSINIIGNPKERGSVLCFTMKGVHPHDIATILDEDGVALYEPAIIAVKFYMINWNRCNRKGFNRVYNSKEDIDILCKAIENCKKVFKNLDGIKRTISRNNFRSCKESS